ncbi:sensor histidine kinase [Chitinophaga solisilvae]|uniref:sensor histidine kinase n=1 Tax=Chitinophaga solisilvae TaxID=1233460 RepID=UPI001368A6A6|nr:sensor histidine kinase [Chitinophaga solisilvae]
MLYFSSVILLLVFITIQQAALDYYFFRNYLARPAMVALRLAKKDIETGVTRSVVNPFNQHAGFYANVMPVQPVTAGTIAIPAMPLNEVRLTTFTPAETISVPALPPGRMMRFMRTYGDSPSFWEYLLFPDVLRRSGFFALLMLFMSGFIKIAVEWFESEKQREALQVEKLNAELKFLKSQINPHFLFNCLNTIYSLAHKQSVQTEHAILKLSTIMRYMIYESNETMVRLDRELKYLQDYIDIQRLRLPKDITVDYAVSGNAGGLQIEPMLLVPFVENAFKHGISYAEPSFIHINIGITENMIRLMVKNSLFRERVAERGGIGLQNVLKRLEMLYDQEHEIDIRETDNQFIVDLKIVLKR